MAGEEAVGAQETTYSDELRRVISKPEKGIILDAELLQDPQTGESVHYPGAVFQLTLRQAPEALRDALATLRRTRVRAVPGHAAC